jgi:outer membrane immunogenic protein
MRKLLVAGIAAAAFCSAPALAANMAVKAPPVAPVAAPVYSWTACYVGGNVGGAWAHKHAVENSFDGSPEAPFDVGSPTFDGWIYGGQIGCDYQLNSNWVVGVRGMWDGSNMKASVPQPPPYVTDNVMHFGIDSFGTAVGEVGYLLAPTLELYGLGGLAWVRDSLYQTDPDIGEWAAGDQTRTGFDVGVGLSWMFAQNWDLFVEYDYMGFGTKSTILQGVGDDVGETYGYNVTQSVNKVLVGIDYRFYWGAAPVGTKG